MATRAPIIGVMGPGVGATPQDCQLARALGEQVAAAGWILLTGGRDCGVMAAACQGARAAGGLTVGILPGRDRTGLSEYVTIPICTGLGIARNAVNILSSDVVVACGLGAGTASEIAMAIKSHKPVVLLNGSPTARTFFQQLDPAIGLAADVPSAIAQIRQFIAIG